MTNRFDLRFQHTAYDLDRDSGDGLTLSSPRIHHEFDIESGLASLAKEIRSRDIRSIAIPALGSGLGGLDWPEVRTLMQATLEKLDDVKVVIFEPGGGMGPLCGALEKETQRATG